MARILLLTGYDYVQHVYIKMSAPIKVYVRTYVHMYFVTSGNINNCLLYTSPSPRDRQKSRMPSSA